MFKISELLNLFFDDRVREIILSSYMLSQKDNKELSDSVFEYLFFLKSVYPDINININLESTDVSNYSYMTNTISLNGFADEITFLHELTHLFSYYHSQFSIPQEYYLLKNRFLSSQENHSLIVSLLNLCREKKERILQSLKVNKSISDNYISDNISNETDYNILQYSVIKKIEDIIDSLYSGRSHTYGLTFVKDNNYLALKSKKSAGHGCDYFRKSGYEFEEMIADYQAIKLIDSKNELFLLLQQILGTEFISFLDERCQVINGEKLIELDLNNSINKK